MPASRRGYHTVPPSLDHIEGSVHDERHQQISTNEDRRGGKCGYCMACFRESQRGTTSFICQQCPTHPVSKRTPPRFCEQAALTKQAGGSGGGRVLPRATNVRRGIRGASRTDVARRTAKNGRERVRGRGRGRGSGTRTRHRYRPKDHTKAHGHRRVKHAGMV